VHVKLPTTTLLVRSVVGAALLLAGCTPSDDSDAAATGDEAGQPADRLAPETLVEPGEPRVFPPAPEVPDGPLDPDLAGHVDALVTAVASARPASSTRAPSTGSWPAAMPGSAGSCPTSCASPSRTPRPSSGGARLRGAHGVELTADPGGVPWVEMTDHLMAWDLPAWPDYRDAKAQVYLRTEPAWQPFFDDADADIDWRVVSWGGVRIDDRPFGSTAPCPRGCIPALDDPALTDAAGGAWYPDDRIVFGVVVDGEALRFPATRWRSTRW
jgi:hypothetical protein